MGIRGHRGRRLAPFAVAAAALVSAAPAAADTFYASPDGEPTDDCSSTEPCDLLTATDSKAVSPDDVVQLVGGVPPGAPFTMGEDQVLLLEGETLRGNPGARPVITSSADFPAIFVGQGGSDVRDLVLSFNGSAPTGAIAFAPAASADRLEVRSETASGCYFTEGVTIRDSVCSGGPHGINADPLNNIASTLRNVTAVGTTDGINVDAGAATSVDAVNVIPFGGTGVDVRAGGAAVTVTLSYSNWDTQQATLPATITSQDDAGSVGNVQFPDPEFVDAANGDFRQAATSTGTLDRGTASGLLVGELDFEGQARVAGSGPDIGADERQLPDQVPPPATAEAPPTGERDAALKSCRKKAKKRDWSKKRRNRCLRKARRLPV